MVNDQWPINKSHLRDKSSAEDEGALFELHIEELVLHGFSPADRSLIGKTVERELLRLLNDQGLRFSVTEDEEFPRLDGGTFQVAPGSKPEAIGLQIARAVHRGLIK
jgi:hypothetical protein